MRLQQIKRASSWRDPVFQKRHILKSVDRSLELRQILLPDAPQSGAARLPDLIAR